MSSGNNELSRHLRDGNNQDPGCLEWGIKGFPVGGL